jgi:hypothetical protein
LKKPDYPVSAGSPFFLYFISCGALATDEFLAFCFVFGFNFSTIRLLTSSSDFPLSASKEKN